MVPIRFSQHEHRILTGQKPCFKRVLPLFSRPYLTAEERARAAAAIAQRERLNAQQERLAKQEAAAIATQERLAKEEAEQKAQRLGERLRSLGINPDEL